MGKEKYREGVFVVVYAKCFDKIKYLLLNRKLHWSGWEFPKGGIEKNESSINSVKREVVEETGLVPLKITSYNVFGKYKYKNSLKDRAGIIGQTYSLYSAEVKKPFLFGVKLDEKEHSGYKWVDFEKAMKMLTYENQKNCLDYVNSQIIKTLKN